MLFDGCRFLRNLDFTELPGLRLAYIIAINYCFRYIRKMSDILSDYRRGKVSIVGLSNLFFIILSWAIRACPSGEFGCPFDFFAQMYFLLTNLIMSVFFTRLPEKRVVFLGCKYVPLWVNADKTDSRFWYLRVHDSSW